MSVGELITAGAAALQRGRWQDARTAFHAALHETETAAALSGLGDALWWQGDIEASVANRTRAYALYRRSDGPDGVAGAVMTALQLCTVYLSSYGDRAVASGWLARAERLVADAGPGPLDAWVVLSRAYLNDDVESAERLIDQARHDHDVDLELCALAAAGLALVKQGATDRGLALTDEAMAGTLGGEYQRLDTVVYTCCDMLYACELAADLPRAAQWCRVADGFIARYGSPYLHLHCRTRYGAVLAACGEWAEADAQLTTAASIGARVAPAVRAKALSYLAELRLRQGRPEEAQALLSDCDDQKEVAIALAAARLAHGDATAAGAILQRHLDTHPTAPMETASVLAMLVEAHIADGDLDTATTAARTLTNLAGQQAHRLLQARAALAAGLLAAAQQQPDTAVRDLDQAKQLFTNAGLPYESARTQLHLARTLTSSKPSAAIVELQQALPTFQRLGATTDADAATSMLRALGAAVPRRPRTEAILTDRETEVLTLIRLGLSNPQIARRLFISRKTVAHHVSNIFTKLGLHNRAEAAAYAASNLAHHPAAAKPPS